MSEKPADEAACLDVIRNTFPLPQLAEYAANRVSYGNSDRGCGLDYDEVEGRIIPPGQVLIYDFWGPPDGYEVFVPEAVYLTVLARVLAEAGFDAEAQQVRSIRPAEPPAPA